MPLLMDNDLLQQAAHQISSTDAPNAAPRIFLADFFAPAGFSWVPHNRLLSESHSLPPHAKRIGMHTVGWQTAMQHALQHQLQGLRKAEATFPPVLIFTLDGNAVSLSLEWMRASYGPCSCCPISSSNDIGSNPSSKRSSEGASSSSSSVIASPWVRPRSA